MFLQLGMELLSKEFKHKICHHHSYVGSTQKSDIRVGVISLSHLINKTIRCSGTYSQDKRPWDN